MSTILIINALSSLLAAVGIGGFLAHERRIARRKAVVQWLYLTTKTTTRPLPHR